jgi:hypothetical protein
MPSGTGSGIAASPAKNQKENYTMPTVPNRKERRKAAKKPLARLGVAIHTGTCRAVLNTPDGPQTKYYWWADEDGNLSPQEIMERGLLHGPFDTEAEAEKAARIACVGPDCKVNEGGRWDPAWDKPQ